MGAGPASKAAARAGGVTCPYQILAQCASSVTIVFATTNEIPSLAPVYLVPLVLAQAEMLVKIDFLLAVLAPGRDVDSRQSRWMMVR